VKKYLTPLIIIFSLISNPASAGHPIAPFEEVVQTADLIFIGTVAGQATRLSDTGKTVLTDVSLNNIEVIHATASSVQKAAKKIVVTYEGGTYGSMTVSASADSPSFTIGQRFVLFMFDDGTTYQNPLIGGAGQGFFALMSDAATGTRYVLTTDGRALLGSGSGGLVTGSRKISSILNGTVYPDTSEPLVPKTFYAGAPVPGNQSDSAKVYNFSKERQIAGQLPLTVTEFKTQIAAALQRPLAQRVFKTGNSGGLFRNMEGTLERQELPLTPSPERAASKMSLRSELPKAAMGACGAHELPLVMELVPAGWPSYPLVNNCMWIWNRFMDIYRVTGSDGTIGFDNGENEFAGWLDDATRYKVYEGHWGTAYAVTTSRDASSTECSKIVESDVQWNPAYSWTLDPAVSLANKDILLFQLVTMHELGHSWGEQRWKYKETYAYDVPTVMQGNYAVVEDGAGIHVTDSYLLRRHYLSQTGILNISDVGVESYYASGGLHNSTTNAMSYVQGQPIFFQNVTVENMGNAAVTDLTIRFYLSEDRTITDSDYLIGSAAWSSFPAEQFTVFSFSSSVPYDVQPGEYNVGAIVTINGLAPDGFMDNNATSFYSPVTVTAAPLSVPAGVSASDGTYTDKVRLTWDPVPHATSYRVFRTPALLYPKTYLGSISGTLYDDKSIPADAHYYYAVQAENAFVKSKVSAFDNGYKKASIKVGSPVAGQICRIGHACDILWAYDGDIGPYVKIVLLSSGSPTGATISASTASGANGSGNFPWNVSPNQPAGSYRVRVRSLGNTTYSATSPVFEISGDVN
jgi:hypothetical protein